MKETVQYYLNKTFGVPAGAFDKVHFGKLFKLLVDRKMPAIVRHLLLDNYTRKNICTTLNDVKSHTFTALNGVHQGGVLLLLLFNVYFDEMIYKLEKSCIGCKIGTHCIGTLAYADDVILLCPSRSGLQEMINICKQFGIDFRVTFNDKKTQSICFSKSNDTGYEPVTLNNEGLKLESKVNHLGNILIQRLDDDYDGSYMFLGTINWANVYS